MAQQAEAGHIRTGMDFRALQHGFRRLVVQLRHGANKPVILRRIQQIRLCSGGQYAGSQRLGQHQRVAGSCAHVPQHPVRADIARDAQAVFRLIVLNGMAAGNHAAGLHRLLVAALQNSADSLLGETARHTQQIHGHGGPSAHGVHIAEGVGRGDLAEPEGIVHNGGEEIHGVDGGDLIGDPIDAGIVAGVKAHQQVGIASVRKVFQNIR